MDNKTKNAMYERIEAHGNKLLAIYPEPITQDPVSLCKRLFRVEQKQNRANQQYCNGTISEYDWERKVALNTARVKDILGYGGPEVIINGDPRGYALKINDSIARNLDIHRDMGGYGIIAPDFRE